MITREIIREDILGLKAKQILCILPTSVGKTKIALDFLNEKGIKDNILIVIPRLVLIDNWKDEIKKWGYGELISKITFTTYVSVPKYSNRNFSAVIFDEAHHLSERARLGVAKIHSNYTILLSATIRREIRNEFQLIWPKLKIYEISIKRAIDDNILPDPKVFLLPLTLDSTVSNQVLVKNPKEKKVLKVPYSLRWTYLYRPFKEARVEVSCTQKEYYDWASFEISRAKNTYMRHKRKYQQNQWLYLCNARLKWLATIKTPLITQLHKYLKNERTLTFCSNIEQTEKLGLFPVNSKNKESKDNLNRFNNREIDHITACDMLNEGINLKDCRIGIYANLNSSERIIKQKLGRLLRHEHPIIIIPYYKDTREEEIVTTMLEDYNPELVKVITNIKEIEL